MPINKSINSHHQTHPAENKYFLYPGSCTNSCVLLSTHTLHCHTTERATASVWDFRKGLLRALQSWFPGPATRRQVLLLCVLVAPRQHTRGFGNSRPFPSLCLFACGAAFIGTSMSPSASSSFTIRLALVPTEPRDCTASSLSLARLRYFSKSQQ